MRFIVAAAVLAAVAGCAEWRGSRAEAVLNGSGPSPGWRTDDVETVIDGWGRVRASQQVLANFPQALWAAPDPNRTVEPCRRAIEAASSRDGPAIVQAAGLGPERRSARGLYEGAVEVRVIYEVDGVRVVRRATMRCITGPDGTFVNAEVLP